MVQRWLAKRDGVVRADKKQGPTAWKLHTFLSVSEELCDEGQQIVSVVMYLELGPIIGG